MEYYRAYILCKDGKIVGAESFHSEDDGAALMHAKAYAEGCGVEVWNLGRFVARLNVAEIARDYSFQKEDNDAARPAALP